MPIPKVCADRKCGHAHYNKPCQRPSCKCETFVEDKATAKAREEAEKAPEKAEEVAKPEAEGEAAEPEPEKPPAKRLFGSKKK